MPAPYDEALAALARLHAEVDEAAARCAATWSEAHGSALRCGPGCSDCCQDGLTVFAVEAERIRARHAALLEGEAPHPEGACAFLDAGGRCRVFTERPYVCRTQGLPLRWLEGDGEGGGLEYRDICPRNEDPAGTPITELEGEVFWTLGPWEERLRGIQEAVDRGEGRRVALRSLFAALAPSSGGPGAVLGVLLALLSLGPAPARAAGSLSLVESAPVETSLDHPGIPDAWQVWPEMIGAARQRLDIAEFYVSDEPGHRLEPVLQAVRAAAKRGVQVRILADAKFHQTYPEPLDSLDALRNVELRLYDVDALMGGVLHAKYFLVDGRELYLGSQNFDWRSLEHIQELGVRTDEPELVRALGGIFEADWALAGGSAREVALAAPALRWAFPVEVAFGADSVRASLVASPQGWLPDEAAWDLPGLVALIDGAQQRVRVQLLNYSTTDKEGRYFDALEGALRRAAARKVEVELLLSDWSGKKWMIEGLQSLECLPGVTVKLVSIPEHSGGFIPFARTVHAKYLVVDGQRAWIGTSNWARDYFLESRNVGLIVDGAPFAAALDGFFLDLWTSPYAAQVDPSAQYKAPRTKE